MIQNIIALIIVAAVLIRVIYLVYKSVTVKDKTICGGCASCDLKHELKKKGKLVAMQEHVQPRQFQFSGSDLKVSGS